MPQLHELSVNSRCMNSSSSLSVGYMTNKYDIIPSINNGNYMFLFGNITECDDCPCLSRNIGASSVTATWIFCLIWTNPKLY